MTSSFLFPSHIPQQHVFHCVLKDSAIILTTFLASTLLKTGDQIYLAMRNTAGVTGGKPIADRSPSFSGAGTKFNVHNCTNFS
jgi:hypothetical protein